MDDSVTRDMESIFGRPPVVAGAEPPARQDAFPAPAGAPAHPRVIAASRAGVAGAGLAGAMALAGLVALSIADRRPSPPPLPATAAPPLARPTTTARVARPTTTPVDVRPLPSPTIATPAARPTPTTVRIQAVPPPVPFGTRSGRPARPAVRRSPAVTPEAPRLTGEALRRALADDVVVTRRLNRAVLEEPSDPPR